LKPVKRFTVPDASWSHQPADRVSSLYQRGHQRASNQAIRSCYKNLHRDSARFFWKKAAMRYLETLLKQRYWVKP